MARTPNRHSKTQEKEAVTETKKTAPSNGPFDVDTVRELVHLMKDHELAEIELAEGSRSLKLKRSSGVVVSHAPVHSAPVQVLASVPAPAAASSAPAAAPAAPAKKLLEIKSPTPGTFYAQDKPGSKAFAEVGNKITPTSVVCIIEAMKIFNEIQAEVAGTIVEVLVENKQPVEYGQVLFRVDPA